MVTSPQKLAPAAAPTDKLVAPATRLPTCPRRDFKRSTAVSFVRWWRSLERNPRSTNSVQSGGETSTSNPIVPHLAEDVWAPHASAVTGRNLPRNAYSMYALAGKDAGYVSRRYIRQIPRVLGPKRPASTHVHGRFCHPPGGALPRSLRRIGLWVRVALRQAAISWRSPRSDTPCYGEAKDASERRQCVVNKLRRSEIKAQVCRWKGKEGRERCKNPFRQTLPSSHSKIELAEASALRFVLPWLGTRAGER